MKQSTRAWLDKAQGFATHKKFDANVL